MQRKAEQLGFVLHQHIRDLIDTGDVHPRLLELDVQISEVCKLVREVVGGWGCNDGREETERDGLVKRAFLHAAHPNFLLLFFLTKCFREPGLHGESVD